MIYILGMSQSDIYDETTSTKLAELMGINFINTFPSTIEDKDILIRYGLSKQADRDVLFSKVLNRGNNILLSVNKLASMKVLSANKIQIPKVFYDNSDITKKDLPVLRRFNRHTRGMDVIVVNDIKDIPIGDYYTKLLKTNREYRVHIINGRCVRIQLKVKQFKGKDVVVRSHSNGYKLADNFNHKRRLEHKVIDTAIKTVKVLGLDFGAVDIIVEKHWIFNRIYVLECNTGPHLDERGRNIYANNFKRILEGLQ